MEQWEWQRQRQRQRQPVTWSEASSQNLKSCVISLNVFWFTIRSITLAAAAIPSPWMMSPPSSFFFSSSFAPAPFAPSFPFPFAFRSASRFRSMSSTYLQ